MDTVIAKLEYYNKFPNILKKALLNNKVKFPETLQYNYDNLYVYRAVQYTNKKRTIERSDFSSYMELKEKNPMIVADENNIECYSCSFFKNIEEMHIRTKFPSKNKAVAKGIIKKEFGPININESTSHIDLYLFKNIDISKEFEVFELWEKNG